MIEKGTTMYPHDRYWQAKKVTLIGAFINALLGVVKMIGGFYIILMLSSRMESTPFLI